MSQTNGAYKAAGVDIDAGNRAVSLMKQSVRATFTPAVLSDVGSFGGLYKADALKQMSEPVLVASTDGVGTKTRVASQMNRWEGIGQDLVNHCINDILVQGAQPLFFMDYVATSKVIPEQLAAIVSGMADACRMAGCALLGGETAEMPGVYAENEVDVAGTIVGVVERGSLITGARIQVSDSLVGIPSSGLHTNGYSLARAALDGLDWNTPRDDLNGVSIGSALLEVHRSYLTHVRDLLKHGIDVHGLAHITGGGIVENLPRILPEGTGAQIYWNWRVPPIFDLIQRSGKVTDEEMFRVFNMGIGMIVAVPMEQAAGALAVLADESDDDEAPLDSLMIGMVVDGDRTVDINMERP